MIKKNLVAKNLMSKRYKPRVVKPKKGRGSFKRKKDEFNILKPCTNLLNNFR